ncbi:response regulator [Pseudomonas typographi]|uniref:Response regulator n=1 Tax=Pseudomonas typographi TaxID=2715964 RepID=A0ABR7Z423_9PSED|nr:response regulator [Pseudomonas typographi]MBD1552020.1 response regulator [Pseudomonas typographi]MBD1586583.1 response regulator [Pseudomonas typographi]MBD1600084.1 response regulator [Pseudomonas typographi]
MKGVLVVDDDSLIRVMMCEAFKEEGYEAYSAENADDALMVLASRSHSIHLVVTDVQMPGSMDGLQLGHVVAERHPDVAVLTMTGYTLKEKAQQAIGPLLQKPFDIEQLMQTAAVIMEKGRFWRNMMRVR